MAYLLHSLLLQTGNIYNIYKQAKQINATNDSSTLAQTHILQRSQPHYIRLTAFFQDNLGKLAQER